MVFRSGKYQGYTVEAVVMIDPGYIRWVRENRPEMLIERKRKIQKIELSEEEMEQKQNYKNLPRESWKSAF